MTEFDDSMSEPINGNDWLIPEIPGVENSESGVVDRETLTGDEFSGESEEDVLEEISLELKDMLKIFGVERLNSADTEEVIQLWHKMEMSQYLVADLALHTTIEKQKNLQSNMVWPHWKDLVEVSATLDNPYDVRLKLIERAAENLMKLGYGRLLAFRLPRRPDEEVAQAYKVQGWLIGLPIMQDLIPQVGLDVTTTGKLTPSRVFRLSLNEIVRQAHIIDSAAVRNQFDSRITYEARAYQDLRKNIKNTYRIAEYALSKFAAR